MNKVKREGTGGICDTCRRATIMRSKNDEVITCGMTGHRVQMKVLDCSAHDPKNIPALWHMEEIAWILKTDPKSGRAIGFRGPQRNRDDESRSPDPGFIP